INSGTGRVLADDGYRGRVRHHVYLESPPVDRIHGQAHAVDRDRALPRDVALEPWRHLDLDHAGAAVAAYGRHAADAVDVAQDQVTVERIAELERRLEIHARAGLEPAERGHRERGRRNVCGKPVRAELDRREASAVHRDARADLERSQRDAGRADHETPVGAEVRALDDEPYAFDDAREQRGLLLLVSGRTLPGRCLDRKLRDPRTGWRGMHLAS